MAFCPNCGTPNTEQAEKCAACGFELGGKNKGKFKGTILMSGVKTSGLEPPVKPSGMQPPVSSPPAATGAESNRDVSPDVEPLPSRPSENSAFARHSTYAKTMLGHVATDDDLPELPRPSRAGMPAVNLPSTPRDSMGSTLPGRAPSMTPSPLGPPAPGVSVKPSAPAAASSAQRGLELAPRPSLPFGRDVAAPRPSTASAAAIPRPTSPKGPSRMVLIGCAGALAVGVIVTALLYYALAPRIARWLRGGQAPDVQAQAWQAQVSQALAQVADLCRDDCQKADVFFHPARQMALLGEAKALTPQRVLALSDPSAKAEMLDRTDDAALASELNLDPQQCVRILRGGSKVISCSVPVPGQQTGELRIVQLSGIGSLQ